jgi:hypothetical protein
VAGAHSWTVAARRTRRAGPFTGLKMTARRDRKVIIVDDERGQVGFVFSKL